MGCTTIGVIVCVCLCVGFGVVQSICPLTDHERRKVPPVFASDDFSKCRSEGNIFCRMQFTLRPEFDNSDSWRIILKSKNHAHCFNRDAVYRFRCLSHRFREGEKLRLNAIGNENELMKHFSLRSNLDKLSCNDYSKTDLLTRFDYVLMLLLICYLAIIVAATIIDTWRRIIREKGGKFIQYFSIRRQWIDLNKPINDPEYKKLKCLQGIRTYEMALVIIGHAISSALFSYPTDEKVIENFYVNLGTRAIVDGMLIIIQTNFMISGWLNAKMVYNQMDRNKQLTLPFIIKKICMRYVRFLPTLAVIICLEMSNWSKVLIAPPPLESTDMDYDACQKNWWATLLMIGNIFPSSEMCNLGLWYLTTDFQMYILSLLMFYVMFKYKIGPKMIVWVMAFFWSITFCLIYYHNMPVVYPYYAKTYQLSFAMASYEMYVLHTSFYINYGSYGVGLLFGVLYHRYKNHNFNFSRVDTCLWLLLFFGLPFIAIYGMLFEYSRLVSAILGPTLKPLFALGIAIGLFGMTNGLGGFIRRICEWDFAEFVARWTYSTYLIHFFVVFGRHLRSDGLVDISIEMMCKSAVADMFQSFIAGLVLHLIIERPMAYVCLGLLGNKLPMENDKNKGK
ncbi:hypothetical protein JTB14_029616 [Gonioctena quinquepunctata]|nr:hypothetical protein JTB14_029616 [Gonioctena quinquepunctata]